MAIRLRTVGGIRVALCAAETDPEPGDVYLDDNDHHALSAKYTQDIQSMMPSFIGGANGFMAIKYPEEWDAMESQKKRDAEQECLRHSELLEQMIAAGIMERPE